MNSRPPPEPPAVGFLFSSGSYTAIVPHIPAQSVYNTYAYGINNAGDIVGLFTTGARGPYYGFLRSGGNDTTVPGPPGSVGGAGVWAINNLGHLLGSSSLGLFLLRDGTYTMLNLPGGPNGLNDADQIVGSSYDEPDGFVLSDGVLTTLRVPGSTFTTAFGINDAGQIVGWYGAADSTYHGFLATPVPAPSNLLLLGLGTLGLIGWAWWRKVAAA
jgi:probable HAF family extracellular repeat protein